MLACVAAAFGLMGHHAADAATYRTWQDNTGQFSVEAEIVSVSSGTVRLRTKAARELSVPIARLSDVDQAYARAWRPDAKAPTAAEPQADRTPRRPTTLKDVLRAKEKRRSAAQVVGLLEWASEHLPSEEERESAAAALPEWRQKAADGLIRHGQDWVRASDVDQRLAEEVRLLREAHRLIDVKNDRLALERFESAGRANPEGIRAAFYLGLLNAVVSHHPNSAVRWFDDCVDRLTRYPDRLIGARRANLAAALNNLAVAQVLTKKYDRAVRNWQRALELSPQTPELVQNLGLLTSLGGTALASPIPNRVGDKAGALYAQATVANGSREFDTSVGWLYMPLIDSLDGTMQDTGDNELVTVGWATGTAISADLLLVPAHLAKEADRFRVYADRTLVAEIASVSEDEGMAAIRVKGLRAKPIEWSSGYVRPSERFSMVGFAQPGYGSETLRSVPTTVLDEREVPPIDVSLLFGVPINIRGVGEGAVVARQDRTIRGLDLLGHSAVADPGFHGAPLCDANGVAVAIHLGRGDGASARSKSSVALSSRQVVSYAQRLVPGIGVAGAHVAAAPTDGFPAAPVAEGATVFQVAALKFAPRLQWSHRIAKLHPTGGSGGWASYEDSTCMQCLGSRFVECPDRNCKRGKLTRYRTVTIEGTGAFKGRRWTKQEPYKVACPTCSGHGRLTCRGCGGAGSG